MYHPAHLGEASLTDEERAIRLKGLTKEIDCVNTRFHGKLMDSRLKDDGSVEVLYTPVAGATPMPMSDRDQDKAIRYYLEDLRKTPNQFYVESGKKAENGYGCENTFTCTSGDGPHFKIPCAPARDVKAHSLSREAARKLRESAIAKSSSSVDETLRASYRGASPGVSTPKSVQSVSRFGRDGSMNSRSPSVREGSNPPWQ
ncbi:putative WRKY transcription factor 20-like [Hibiscus syriacus]|uniref:WRKY transcription factor 20-like n=1 Tax=Hibiscus syriacus TaxID=106335 RepID=A0A6A2XG40_HIBSY|nr:putative WRKY transcription factor 20-like [Hibiscus syriacus]